MKIQLPLWSNSLPSAPHPVARMLAAASLEAALLAVGVGVYLLTRLAGLDLFPIYFFSDEAILVVSAQELLENGLRSKDGTLLPTYMRNADRWNLGLPVYIHLASLALFGKSVVVARATSAMVSLVGVLAVAAALKWVFQNRFWWSAVLVMAVIPAWFLHSRTAFDPVMMAAFYACFLCTYLLYRCRSPRFLYAVVVFAAAVCYSYPNGQAVILASAVMLVVSDLRYHLRQPPRILLGAVLLAAVLVLPLLRFLIEQPGAWADQLRVLNAYVVQPIPLAEKAATFARLYGQGLSPFYWFFPNNVDWVRHRWYGLGHLGQYLLPLVVLGLGRILLHWRSPAHRAVLVAVLAAPVGAALYKIEVTRTLAMVVPSALLAVMGLEQVYLWVARLGRQTMYPRFAASAAVVFSLGSLVLLGAALGRGPTWYNDYGLYGMQYGAGQVFSAIREELSVDPGRRVMLTHTWANNPNAFIPFFLDESQQRQVEMVSIDPFLMSRREVGVGWLFVMTAEEYAAAQASGKFQIDPPERVVPYPNDEPGFYFVSLAYSPQADAILAAEREQRRQLVESTATLHGQTVRVRHSQLDLGEIESLFDGRRETIIRGVEANPLVLEFHFPEALAVGTILIEGWSPEIDLWVELAPPNDGPAERFEASFRSPVPDPHITFPIPGGSRWVSRLRVEIANAGAGDVSKVHIRELGLEP